MVVFATRWHAVDASEVTAISDGEAQVRIRSTGAVGELRQAAYAKLRGRRGRSGYGCDGRDGRGAKQLESTRHALPMAAEPRAVKAGQRAFGRGPVRRAVAAAIRDVVARVAEYVPGYRLVKDPIFEPLDHVTIPGFGDFSGTKVTTFLEVEGAGDWLPRYAGNLDIMTAAAVQVGPLVVSPALVEHALDLHGVAAVDAVGAELRARGEVRDPDAGALAAHAKVASGAQN